MNLIDSDAVIDDIQRGTATAGAISTITLLEILRGVDEGKRRMVKDLLEKNYEVHGIDNDVILCTCDLDNKVRIDGEKIPEANLIIAATAITRDSALVTGDRHFQRLKKYGLRLIPRK